MRGVPALSAHCSDKTPPDSHVPALSLDVNMRAGYISPEVGALHARRDDQERGMTA